MVDYSLLVVYGHNKVFSYQATLVPIIAVARSEFSMVSDRSFFMPRNVNGASSDKSR